MDFVDRCRLEISFFRRRSFPSKLHRIKSLLLRCRDHDFDVCGRRFQLELQLSQLAREEIERDERDDRDGQTAHGRDQRLANAAGDLAGGPFDRRAAQVGLQRAQVALELGERDGGFADALQRGVAAPDAADRPAAAFDLQ